jgi:uncharacterized protein YebE (UPF0316 family)
VAGYALGFAAGVLVGMMAEERLAIGYSYLRVYSPGSGKAIADALRESGHAVTEFTARGKDGLLTVVNCVIARRDAARARAIIEKIDPNAFITIDEARALQRGYFRH